MTIHNFAIRRTGTGKAELQAVPLPHLPDDYILVRTVAVALNPTDWTTLDAPGAIGTTMGCDYAGVVERVGSAVSRKFAKGDRIAGISHGGMGRSRSKQGSFAQSLQRTMLISKLVLLLVTSLSKETFSSTYRIKCLLRQRVRLEWHW